MNDTHTLAVKSLLNAYLSHEEALPERIRLLAEYLKNETGVALAEVNTDNSGEVWKKVGPALERFLGLELALRSTKAGQIALIRCHETVLRWISPIAIKELNLWASHRDYDAEDPICRVVLDNNRIHAVKLSELVKAGVRLP